jgi:phage tail tube protein FII
MFSTKRTAIEANSIYDGGVLQLNDAKVTLPEIIAQTADVQMMGTASLPLLGLLDDMETTITKTGIDKKSTILTKPGVHNIEVRWVQDVVSPGGETSQEGCKAFLKCIPKTLGPAADIEIGSTPEHDITYTVLRYRLVVNGEEVLLVDRTAGKIKVNGKDIVNYAKYL